MIFHWSLSDSKSSQVSRTLLSILADLNNAVVWMVSTYSLISKSSSPCTNTLVNVPSVPITIDITVTFMFHSFFSSLKRPRHLSLFSLSFILPCSQPEQQSPLFGGSFFMLTITGSGRLNEIRWSVRISKSLRILFVWFLAYTYTICSYNLPLKSFSHQR